MKVQGSIKKGSYRSGAPIGSMEYIFVIFLITDAEMSHQTCSRPALMRAVESCYERETREKEIAVRKAKYEQLQNEQVEIEEGISKHQMQISEIKTVMDLSLIHI